MKKPAQSRTSLRDEIDALKAGFRREDQALADAGRGREVLVENLALMGIDVNSGKRPRLVTVNGVPIRS